MQITNVKTGEIFENPTPAELIQSWKDANDLAKACKKQIDIYKNVAYELDLEPDTPIHDGLGIVQVTRRVMKYDRTLLNQFLDRDEIDLFLEVNKTKLDKWAKKERPELKLKDALYEDSCSSYLQLKEL